VGGRGNKFGGLLVWVVIGGGIVIGSIVSGVGRGGRTNLSVVGLTCGALLGVAGVVLEVGVGGWRGSNGVGWVEGGIGVVSGCIGVEKSWAEFFSLQGACRLLSTGFRRSLAVEVVSRLFCCVEREVGWCCEWFVVVDSGVIVGSVNSE